MSQLLSLFLISLVLFFFPANSVCYQRFDCPVEALECLSELDRVTEGCT